MKTHQSLRRVALAIATSALVLCARAESTTSLKHGDKSFLESAAKSGMEEVAVSQAALPHLMNPEVQQFAKMMIADHSAANEQLATLAAAKTLALPTKMADTAKWDKKKEKGYDEDYIEKMVKDHEDAVQLFTKASKKSDDPDVQAFAAKTLPALEAHYAQAKALKKMVK